ncbi:MAG: hypothetical protein JW774_08115 [Candidatus Aureabacteria bacterium]|nr:hypothetical protein [Candidatus Auribacterota bacterium]
MKRFGYLIILVIIFLMAGFQSHAEGLEGLDCSLSSGAEYYDISTGGEGISSNAYIINMIAQIHGTWTFSNRFFLKASGNFPILEGNDREIFSSGGVLLQKNDFSLNEKSFELLGGKQLFPLLQPFFGFSVSKLKLERSGLKNFNGILMDDQLIREFNALLGVKGNYSLTDYASIGYAFTYHSPGTDVEFKNTEFKKVDSFKVTSELFLKYWLPNEFCQVGLHIYGGKYYYDEKSTANELLPETDIKFLGALLKFKIKL